MTREKKIAIQNYWKPLWKVKRAIAASHTRSFVVGFDRYKWCYQLQRKSKLVLPENFHWKWIYIISFRCSRVSVLLRFGRYDDMVHTTKKKKTLSRPKNIINLSTGSAYNVRSKYCKTKKNEILKFNVPSWCLIWRLNKRQTQRNHEFSYFKRRNSAARETQKRGTYFPYFRKHLDLLTHHFFGDYVIVQLFSFLCACPSLSRSLIPSESPSFYVVLAFWLSYLLLFLLHNIFLSYKKLFLVRCGLGEG